MTNSMTDAMPAAPPLLRERIPVSLYDILDYYHFSPRQCDEMVHFLHGKDIIVYHLKRRIIRVRSGDRSDDDIQYDYIMKFITYECDRFIFYCFVSEDSDYDAHDPFTIFKLGLLHDIPYHSLEKLHESLKNIDEKDYLQNNLLFSLELHSSRK